MNVTFKGFAAVAGIAAQAPVVPYSSRATRPEAADDRPQAPTNFRSTPLSSPSNLMFPGSTYVIGTCGIHVRLVTRYDTHVTHYAHFTAWNTAFVQRYCVTCQS